MTRGSSANSPGWPGLLARAQKDRTTERQKLRVALDLFTALNMPRERDAVQAELEKSTGE